MALAGQRDPEPAVIGGIAGLLVHLLHEHPPTSSREWAVFAPVRDAFARALQQARLPDFEIPSDPEKAFAVIWGLISTPGGTGRTRRFLECSMGQLAADPALRAVHATFMGLLHGTSPVPDAASAEATADAIAERLLDTLIPRANEALRGYIAHQLSPRQGPPGGPYPVGAGLPLTLGFLEAARASRLVAGGASGGATEAQVEREQRVVAQQLAILTLLRYWNTDLDPGEKRTLTRWARKGWILPGKRRKLDSILNNVWLGAMLDGLPEVHRDGAIVQGLVHWFMVHVLQIPLLTDQLVAGVECPSAGPGDVALLLATAEQLPGCPVCSAAEIDFADHRVIGARRNIAAAPGTFWSAKQLYTCPGEASAAGLIGEHASRAARDEAGGEAVLARLLGSETRLRGTKRGKRSSAGEGHERTGRSLVDLITGFEELNTPELDDRAMESIRGPIRSVLAELAGEANERAAIRLIGLVARLRFALERHRHYVPRAADRACPQAAGARLGHVLSEGTPPGRSKTPSTLFFYLESAAAHLDLPTMPGAEIREGGAAAFEEEPRGAGDDDAAPRPDEPLAAATRDAIEDALWRMRESPDYATQAARDLIDWMLGDLQMTWSLIVGWIYCGAVAESFAELEVVSEAWERHLRESPASRMASQADLACALDEFFSILKGPIRAATARVGEP